ncbi:MAG TPA: MFS transporter, partial [Thermopolyspora sp.]
MHEGMLAPVQHPSLILMPLLIGTFIGTISNNIVNVPLREIATELRVPVSRGVLVVVGFMLTFAVAMPLTGWLGDRIGRRRVYCAALVALAVSSVGAAAAPTLEVLVAFRMAQGLATAAVLPAVMGMIADIFTERQRGRALGWWAGVNGLGQAVGPTFGGVMAQFASWRWVFVPAVPLALLALVTTIRLVPADRP